MSTQKLVLNRNFVLRSTSGHAIGFVKGVPTHVPPGVWAEAIAIGAVPEDGSDPNVLPEEARLKKDPAGNERVAVIRQAIDDLFEMNRREDFTAAGRPTVEAVSTMVEFKVSAREIDAELTARAERELATKDA